MEQNSVRKEEFLKLNFFQKIWYSVTKFERYPEMAALGVRKALIYFTELMAVFSILFTLIFVYYASNVAEFEEENLTISQKIIQILANDNQIQGQDIGLQEMVDSIKDTPESAIVTSLFLGNFMSYYLITLIDVFTLSIFGMLTCWIAKIRMNYKAVFNMSIFALTLSIILRLIYLGVNLLLNFEIKNFSIMYIAVSYISLAAAIFLIKSDVIKQHLELMRIIEESKGKIDQAITKPKEPDEEEKDEDKKENKDEKKETEGPTRRRRIKSVKWLFKKGMNFKMSKNNDKNKKDNQHDILYGGIILICLSVIIAWVAIGLNSGKKDDKTISYTDLITQITIGNVKEVEMTTGANQIKVILKNKLEDVQNLVDEGNLDSVNTTSNETQIENITNTSENESVSNTTETESEEEIDPDLVKNAIIPSTQTFVELIQNEKLAGNDINLVQKKPNILTTIPSYIVSLLPTLIMVALFIMIFKMQGLGDKGEVYDETERKTKVKFEDVAGLDEEKEEMVELVQFLKEPKKFIEMGAKIPRGVLLYGKPGTGKTLIAKAIAGEAGVPFISMSGSEFIEMFAGLGASRVRKLFEKARKLAPCIVFIDEIDAIGSRRTSGSGAETENNQTLNQLLVEMDGFSSDETIIVLAATNRPEMLDKALLRPGRFDRQITIPAPDKKGREEILKIHSKDKKLDENVSLESIAEDTAGFTGAELANILNEAAIIATKNEHEKITEDDIEEAVKKVTVGLEKKARVISDKDKRLTAYHEAGHAIVSWYLPTQKKVKEISIIPRGMAGGYTMYKSDEDKSYISKTEMEEKLIALLGGRAAEKIALNDISTGASNDIEVATTIAKEMIVKYGMNEEIGPISLRNDNGEYELDMFGKDMGDKIGVEVKKLIDIAYNDAQTILRAHMDKLDLVAEELLKKEKINEEGFKKFFSEEENQGE